MQPDEESALVRAVAAGDRDAFRRLVQSHQRPLLAFARRMLQDPAQAEDVVQETLLRLWSRAARFEPGRARLTTWLHNIARNLCIDVLRRQQREPGADAGGDRGNCRHGDPPVDRADENADGNPVHREERERLARRVQSLLAALPERQRSALVLCHYQGFSNREASEILELSVDALESLLARARRTLKKELNADHAD
ncbi:MAG: sigma-70 family RNA polymerase sigma factor [Halieaceae bacterium]|nr:sigma-70 family RNA polymerase sigma factor [Halieaceae bacterium]